MFTLILLVVIGAVIAADRGLISYSKEFSTPWGDYTFEMDSTTPFHLGKS